MNFWICLAVVSLYYGFENQVIQPFGRAAVVSLDGFGKKILQLTSNWPSAPAAYRAEVNLADGQEFGGRAANKEFVRIIELFP